MIHVSDLLFIFAFSLASPPPETQSAPLKAGLSLPVCEAPSHDRLIERNGRDVCGPALDKDGRPRSVGFMPTRCEVPEATLRTDVSGTTDYCVGDIPEPLSPGDTQ